ncbi:uncharacterized protein L201_001929 [Kwoniella dendrophila CBS 6074]|uniref:ATP-dependent DNA helicase n=1 Tax=Kwoniella dendrophila CBS 6074 TaxID=1295534 RepID=A0AAX4JNU9_9TREE
MTSFNLYSDRLTIRTPSNGQSSSSRHPAASRSSFPESKPFVPPKPLRNNSSSEPIMIDSDEDDIPIIQSSGSRTHNDSQISWGGGLRLGNRNQSTSTDTNDSQQRPLDIEAREAIQVALTKLDKEIKDVEAQIRPLQELHTSLNSERRALEAQLAVSNNLPKSTVTSTTTSANPGLIDYQKSDFPFSDQIVQNLKKIFHLNTFRLCQEGVINAAMDRRDIVCVMPTGGGKSLTYQLPAVMGNGLTVVISPLLALIWDQVRALKEIGIECVMMTGATSTSEQNEIYERMKAGATRYQKEIRLCYVTPEKVSKSKRLISTLEKVNEAGRLNEAHCCSQLGHDFRPDYKKLSMLKTLFPRVPIQAVTATLSSKTLPDLLKILRLGPITDGSSAKTTGTVFFSAPLFRPNLHYKVLSKPSNAKSAIAAMGDWIQKNHQDQSGIIYCLSKKDAETVAEELREWSGGNIKTGIYHAGVEDYEKERIHVRWREGKVNCICATIAFGLGIDKGDVRYMSKSLEGYYQETGRAGRDGQDSDCVLFYRGQDAARLSSLTYGDVDGSSKLQEMLRFAQDLKTCRKVAFAKYFSASAHLSASAWDAPDALSSSTGTTSTCGICDNCMRSPESIITKDVTVESWKIMKIAQFVQSEGGRVTLANLSDLVRGLGGGLFGVVGGGEGKKGKRRLNGEKERVDLEALGGKITLSKDDTEALLIHLVLLGYLADSYHATAYSVNVYIIASDTAVRLTRLKLQDVEAGRSVKIECTFPVPEPKRTKAKKGKRASDSDEEDEEEDEDHGSVDNDGDTGKDKGNANKKAKTDTKPKAKSEPRAKGKGKQIEEEEEAGLEREWFDIDINDDGTPAQLFDKKSKAKPKAKAKVGSTSKAASKGGGRGRKKANLVEEDIEYDDVPQEVLEEDEEYDDYAKSWNDIPGDIQEDGWEIDRLSTSKRNIQSDTWIMSVEDSD